MSAPKAAAFCAAVCRAAALMSDARTRASGRSSAMLTATAPLPVPKSHTLPCGGSLSRTASTRCSVSGRGNQYVGIDAEHAPVKFAFAQNIGHRLALNAAVRQFLRGSGGVFGHFAAALRQQLHARAAECALQQHSGFVSGQRAGAQPVVGGGHFQTAFRVRTDGL